MSSELPKTMKAAVVDAAGPPEAVHIKEVPVPRLTRDHVIIALDYAGVGSWDAMLRKGAWGPVEPGTILGSDGSGTIAAAAADVQHLHVGDRVYSYSYGNPQGGFHAEYVSVRADRVEHVPTHLDQAVAGAMPCVALTALSGLEALELKRGQTLLVFGASGGVGSLAVWIASTMGATVVGTARPDAHEYVRKLGAAHAIDPNSSEREAVLRRVAPNGFDAALVTANGNALPALLAHLRPGAKFAYPDGVEPEPHVEGHEALVFDGEMTREAFERLNRVIGSRTIPLRLEVFPLEDAVDAHRRIDRGHVIGKVVLRIR
ncbi:MAG: quinone oxidoreductase family protein [Vulcanimicrobiaceae bacterium]